METTSSPQKRKPRRVRIPNKYAEKTQTAMLASIRKYSIVIGIDPGTNTGFTAYNCDTKQYLHCETLPIHIAIFRIEKLVEFDFFPRGMLIIVEDSRHISGPNEKKLGAGSIRRDCSIWEDYLEELVKRTSKDITFIFVRPTNNKYLKMNPHEWTKYSKYQGNRMPSEHARDSATYLFKYINS